MPPRSVIPTGPSADHPGQRAQILVEAGRAGYPAPFDGGNRGPARPAAGQDRAQQKNDGQLMGFYRPQPGVEGEQVTASSGHYRNEGAARGSAADVPKIRPEKVVYHQIAYGGNERVIAGVGGGSRARGPLVADVQALARNGSPSRLRVQDKPVHGEPPNKFLPQGPIQIPTKEVTLSPRGNHVNQHFDHKVKRHFESSPTHLEGKHGMRTYNPLEVPQEEGAAGQRPFRGPDAP